MLNKIPEAFKILWRHLSLFGAIVLTVWIPGNLFINYVNYYGVGVSEMGSISLTLWVTVLLDSLCVGAVLHALYQIKMGRSVGYLDAMKAGVKNWSTLFVAQLIAGVFVLIGLIALVVPGVVLMVRYGLLGAAVVFENAGPVNARLRSVQLTEGRRWPMFWAFLVCFLMYFVAAFVLYLPLEWIDSLNVFWVEAAIDCLLEVFITVAEIVGFLFYLEAVCEEAEGMGEEVGSLQ